jgi:nucleotide-binding universal stress UspA family protein
MLYNLNMKRKFSKILVAMDGSGSSKNAARYATMMAKKNNSELIVIHILTPDGYAYLFDIPPSDAGSLEELMNISRHVVMNWIVSFDVLQVIIQRNF